MELMIEEAGMSCNQWEIGHTTHLLENTTNTLWLNFKCNNQSVNQSFNRCAWSVCSATAAHLMILQHDYFYITASLYFDLISPLCRLITLDKVLRVNLAVSAGLGSYLLVVLDAGWGCRWRKLLLVGILIVPAGLNTPIRVAHILKSRDEIIGDLVNFGLSTRETIIRIHNHLLSNESLPGWLLLPSEPIVFNLGNRNRQISAELLHNKNEHCQISAMSWYLPQSVLAHFRPLSSPCHSSGQPATINVGAVA